MSSDEVLDRWRSCKKSVGYVVLMMCAVFCSNHKIIRSNADMPHAASFHWRFMLSDIWPLIPRRPTTKISKKRRDRTGTSSCHKDKNNLLEWLHPKQKGLCISAIADSSICMEFKASQIPSSPSVYNMFLPQCHSENCETDLQVLPIEVFPTIWGPTWWLTRHFR